MDGGSTGTELIEIVKGGHTPGPPQQAYTKLQTQTAVSWIVSFLTTAVAVKRLKTHDLACF